MENENPLFVKGHFSDRIWRGDTPDYTEPTSSIPETKIENMNVETGYIVALKRNSQNV